MNLREAIQPRRFQNAENPQSSREGARVQTSHATPTRAFDSRPQTDALPSVLLEVIYEGILR
jgi:hypothetical protein